MSVSGETSLRWFMVAIIALTASSVMWDKIGVFMDYYRSPDVGLLAQGFDDSSQPGAGEALLPPSVRSGIHLLRAAGVDSYRLNGRFASDPLLSQRISEGAWPIRRQHGSSIVLGFVRDVATDCTVILTQKDVALAECRP